MSLEQAVLANTEAVKALTAVLSSKSSAGTTPAAGSSGNAGSAAGKPTSTSGGAAGKPVGKPTAGTDPKGVAAAKAAKEKAAAAAKAAKEKAAAESAEAEGGEEGGEGEGEEGGEISLDSLREQGRALIKAGKKAEMNAAIKEQGADSITLTDPANYQALSEAFAALLSDDSAL